MAKFVVHEHKARKLHWDLRLETGYVLRSWAIPKNPTLAAKKRLLAIQTKDHDLAYINFEGLLPEGTYGAGVVKIWDKGVYKMLEQKPDKMVFEIQGEKLKGTYCLVKFKDKRGKENWLFFKTKSKP
jgi:DNA ligase D-like protein (predicted 3'-phosphoesterase)